MKKPRIQQHSKLPIIVDLASRRMFLKGMGSLLALPLLPSLVQYAEAASGFDGCIILTNVTHGCTHWAFQPPNQQLTTVAPNVHAQNLDAFANLGPILGTKFNDIKSKISLLQGLDQNSRSDHYWYPWSASRQAAENIKLLPEFPYSIDSVMAESSKIYPTRPALDVLRIDPQTASQTFSYLGPDANGKAIQAGAEGATVLSTWNAVKNYINVGGDTNTGPDKSTIKRKYMADKFLEEAQAVSKSSAIGSEDKVLLDNFIDHLHEVQKKVGATTPTPPPTNNSCSIPNFQEATDNFTLNRRLLDIMSLAMACGITKIGTYHLNWATSMHSTNNLGKYVQPNVHGTIHKFNTEGSADMVDWWGHATDHYSYLVHKMDALGLLDKSAIVFTSDFASSTKGHHGIDLPVVVAGGLNGKLRTGEVINFYNNDVGMYNCYTKYEGVSRYVRVCGGRRWNEFLITLMQAAGLSPSDYEKNGRKGFGTYDCNISGCEGAEGGLNGKLSDYQNSAAYAGALNVPLPYYFKG